MTLSSYVNKEKPCESNRTCKVEHYESVIGPGSPSAYNLAQMLGVNKLSRQYYTDATRFTFFDL